MIAHINRIKTSQPHSRSGWCDSCDRASVRYGAKCPACGNKQKTNRAKKPSPMFEGHVWLRYNPRDPNRYGSRYIPAHIPVEGQEE